MYFPDDGLLRVYPGSKIPDDYNPKKSEWFKLFKKEKGDLVGTGDYTDSIAFGDDRVISLGVRLIENGYFVCDIPVSKVYSILD
jgi:hypothetical protein